MNTRVPLDPGYATLIGTAVYVFAYYEWAIIYLIEQCSPGFVARYSRGSPMTSGRVKQELDSILNHPATDYSKVPRQALEACRDRFAGLIDRRNALIHADPATADDGSQMLVYQTKPDKSLPDMKWPATIVEQTIHEFDTAACEANKLLHCLL